MARGGQLLIGGTFCSPKYKQYHHELSAVDRGQRYQLSVLRAQGMSILATARAIGVHRSTLYRELRRNAGPQGYQPDNAHQHATHRRASAAKSRLSADVIQFVELTLAWWWSPEQISTVGKQIGLMVSHGGYTAMWPPTKPGVASCTAICARATSALPQGASSLRSPIKEARSIDERPAIVDSQERLGDWEADTVLGKQRHRCTGHPGGAQRAGSIWSSGSRANRLGWCGMR